MQASRERIEQARLGARSAARDLLRLVRALDAHGIDPDALQDGYRDILESCNHELATALSIALEATPASDDDHIAKAESTIAETKARFAATRTAILDQLGRQRRVQVLEAMMAVEVADEDLEVDSIEPTEEEIAAAMARAERRLELRRKHELRRRHAESVGLDTASPAAKLYARLPKPWQTAIFRNAGLAGHPTPVATARYLADPHGLAALIGSLRRGDREALGVLLSADGIMLARALESRFGDSSHDGYEWHREPPTSVLGRLRARGLIVVGRAALGPNPRSRPRVAIMPKDLRKPIAEALAAVPLPVIAELAVSQEVIDTILDDDDETDEEAEAEGIRFERAQPELADMAETVAECLSEAIGPGPLMYYVARVFAMFEAAHAGQVPRLRQPDLEAARQESNKDLEAVEMMHERLLERRVAHMIAAQPHVYACLAAMLDDLPWSEEDKLLVFHACDTALRAFHASLS